MVGFIKKNICLLGLVLILGLLASSCDTRAAYDTESVTIDIHIKQLNSGYCEVEFKPSSSAWYYVAMMPIDYYINPQDNPKEFMALALDDAYIQYIVWRHNRFLKSTPYVADFASHSLQFRETDYYFHYLQPDTDYWLIAFVVDPKSNEPRGELFCQTVHTQAQSDLDVTFQYKVSGNWDYGYPLDQFGNLTTDIPWVGFTFDSVDIADEMTRMTPKQFFGQCYDEMVKNKNAHILLGIYAHCNDGQGDGTSTTKYEEGHTYYTCMATFDGHFARHAIYKFTWTKDIEATFMPESSLSDEW